MGRLRHYGSGYELRSAVFVDCGGFLLEDVVESSSPHDFDGPHLRGRIEMSLHTTVFGDVADVLDNTEIGDID